MKQGLQFQIEMQRVNYTQATTGVVQHNKVIQTRDTQQLCLFSEETLFLCVRYVQMLLLKHPKHNLCNTVWLTFALECCSYLLWNVIFK